MYVAKAKFYFAEIGKRFHGKCLFTSNANLIQGYLGDRETTVANKHLAPLGQTKFLLALNML